MAGAKETKMDAAKAAVLSEMNSIFTWKEEPKTTPMVLVDTSWLVVARFPFHTAVAVHVADVAK